MTVKQKRKKVVGVMISADRTSVSKKETAKISDERKEEIGNAVNEAIWNTLAEYTGSVMEETKNKVSEIIRDSTNDLAEKCDALLEQYPEEEREIAMIDIVYAINLHFSSEEGGLFEGNFISTEARNIFTKAFEEAKEEYLKKYIDKD